MARKRVVWVPPGAQTSPTDGVEVKRMKGDRGPARPRRKPKVWVKAGEGFSAPVEAAEEGPVGAAEEGEGVGPPVAPAGGTAPASPKAPAAKTAPASRKAPAAKTAPASRKAPAAKTAPAKDSFGWNLAAAVRRPGEQEGDHGGEESLSVPPEIEAMAQEVMGRYEMTVSGMQLITTKPDKGGAIWRTETDHGPRSLKLLHRPVRRSLFSIGAQEYLVSQGARVPALVRSKTGENHVVVSDRVWIVTDWIEGLTPATKVGLEGAQALCQGLGEFHRLSKGYVAPPEAERSSRLHKWPRTYQKILTKIGWFRVLAQAYSDMPASPVLLSMVDRFERQAAEALQRLERSPYRDLAARGEAFWGIVHQDDRRRGNGCRIAWAEVVAHAGSDPAGDCAGPGGRVHTLVDR